jgi:hypothetical protein
MDDTERNAHASPKEMAGPWQDGMLSVPRYPS